MEPHGGSDHRCHRKNEEQQAWADSVNIVFPTFENGGTHVNVSTGGVLANAPNRENAVKFLEYLASDQAQLYFSAGNDEYPAVPGVGLSGTVAQLGLFRQAWPQTPQDARRHIRCRTTTSRFRTLALAITSAASGVLASCQRTK